MPSTRRQMLTGLAATLTALPARARAGGADNFRTLEARRGMLQLVPQPARQTQVLGYDGTVPGPLLRAKLGEAVNLRLLNKLEQPTALHFLGQRLPNALDGVPGLTQAMVATGGTFDYSFTASESGISLYRPSLLSNHAQQMARGMFGLMVVDEAEPPLCDLDLIATLEYWQLDEKSSVLGAFNTLPDGGHAGAITRLVTLNGGVAPDRRTLPPGSRIRLRLVNACISRLAAISFEGVRPLLMAIDSQNCEPFEPVRRTLPAGPGSRFELMFDLAVEAGREARVILRGDNEPDRDLVVFRTSGAPRPALMAIKGLPLNPRLPAVIRLQDAKRVEMTIEANPRADALHGWKINGVAHSGIPPKPLFSVKAGTPVLVGLANKANVLHVMHFHGHNIRLLHDLDDGWEPYWRDNLVIEPGKAHHIAFIADNPGKWLIESLALEYGGAGLATWFEVL